MNRIWTAAIAIALALPFSALAQEGGDTGSQQPQFTEGKDYARIEPAQPTDNPGKVEVMEVFWYGCPHCYDFEPQLARWTEEEMPEYAVFKRLPAVLNRQWEVHARAYYTAQALGVLDEVHKPLFDAIHEDNRRLNDNEAIAKFFAEHGISAENYLSTAESFAVENKLRRAASLPGRLGISGVPAMVVNGKYRIDARMAGSYDKLLDTVEYLVGLEKPEGEAADTGAE
jgi:thiol:disulfide interchange protein DsbA